MIYIESQGIIFGGGTMIIDKGFIGGSTMLLLLSLLAEGDRYGYEIIRELETRSDSTFQFKEGTLYPVLHKLENNGYVKSYLAKGETGKERKYYQITKSGNKQLAEEREKWEQFSTSVNKVIGGGTHALA
jgi:PadR family transcriptional regulator, regulatory protein PadR